MDIAQREVSGFKTVLKLYVFGLNADLNCSVLKIYFCFQKLSKLCIKGKLLIAKERMWYKDEPSVDYKKRGKLPAS